MLVLYRIPLLLSHNVSRRTCSVHECGLADPVRQAGNRYKPLDQRHLACRSCGRKHLALEVEAAAKSCPCSISAVVGVVLGTRSRPTAGAHVDGHLAVCEPAALLVVVVVVWMAVEGLVLRAFAHSIEPSSLCRSSA